VTGSAGPAGPDGGLLDTTVAALEHRLARSQAEARLPSVVAAVCHDGALAWTGAAGRVGDAPPTPDTQYRIGSITKTFTAVLVMRLRDDGRLRLEDTVDHHVAGSPFGDRTIASLLMHTSGLQAETGGPWWERTGGGDFDGLVADLDGPGVVEAAGRHYHYSNLGYGVLGRIIEAHHHVPWAQVVDDTLLRPLGLGRTTYGPDRPARRRVRRPPLGGPAAARARGHPRCGGDGPAGQLWSTITDLAAWGRFLAGDTGDVLDPDTLEEMCDPVVVHDTAWTVGHGLGIQVFRRDDHRWVGHGGSMPGFLALLLVDREQQAVSCAMANTTAGMDSVVADLLDTVITTQPRQPRPWEPQPVPDDILDALGPWYWGPTAVALRHRGGTCTSPNCRAGRASPGSSRTTTAPGAAWTATTGANAAHRPRRVRHADPPRPGDLRVHADALRPGRARSRRRRPGRLALTSEPSPGSLLTEARRPSQAHGY
jgi:CubicO group peptidase (beta-lactamase class C family)